MSVELVPSVISVQMKSTKDNQQALFRVLSVNKLSLTNTVTQLSCYLCSSTLSHECNLIDQQLICQLEKLGSKAAFRYKAFFVTGGVVESADVGLDCCYHVVLYGCSIAGQLFYKLFSFFKSPG